MYNIEEALADGLTIVEPFDNVSPRVRQRGVTIDMNVRRVKEGWSERLRRIASVEIVPHTELTRAELEAMVRRDLTDEDADLWVQEASDRWSLVGNPLVAM